MYTYTQFFYFKGGYSAPPPDTILGVEGGFNRRERVESRGSFRSTRPPPTNAYGDEKPLRSCRNPTCTQTTYYTYCSGCNKQNKDLTSEYMTSTCEVCRRRFKGDFRTCGSCLDEA